MLALLKKALGTERIALDVIFIYIYKVIYHSNLFNFFLNANNGGNRILFIIGCQRSGTSLMNRIFTRDFNVSVYRESSQLSSKKDPEKLRLNSYQNIEKKIKKNKAKYIIVKPLVETQNILQLLDYFPNSKALWMYRNYKDFIQSSIKRFDLNVGFNALNAIINKDPNDWRSENVSDYVYSVVTRYFKEEMSRYDASALFWFARNQIFYDLNLNTNPNVSMTRYEDLVKYPNEVVREIYNFMGVKYVAVEKLVQEINPHALEKGSAVKLTPEIEELCEELLTRMNNTYFIKHPTLLKKN
jgi:hypothetical protein